MLVFERDIVLYVQEYLNFELGLIEGYGYEVSHNRSASDMPDSPAASEYCRASYPDLVSVPAEYDGEQIRLLEEAPVQGPYRVLGTFVEPAPEQAPPDLERFWSSFGSWQDDRPVEATLDDIHEARRSRSEPPAL